MAMAVQPGGNSRFSDLCDEPVDHLLSPIKGYYNKPLVPLTETVEPVSGFFNEIEDNVYVALHNCANPADGLNQQESASIYLYTMQFDGGPSLYVLLNQALRAENREELIPWFSFLKLFLTALHKLPSQSKIVWRGVKNVDLSAKYKTSTKFAWWGVSSCTTDLEVLKSNEFLGKKGQRTLFSIECVNGKSVTNHSYFKNTEKEIILMPGSYFEVIGQLNPASQLHIIQLKEISPPITLVKLPFSKSTNVNASSAVNQSNTSFQSTSNMIQQNTVTSNISSNQIPLGSKTSAGNTIRLFDTSGCLNLSRSTSGTRTATTKKPVTSSISIRDQLTIDLYNFDHIDFADSKYVLTSPRSLEACARLNIKPAALLPEKVSDIVSDKVRFSTFVNVRDQMEIDRLGKLQRCREERENVIREALEKSSLAKTVDLTQAGNKRL